MYTMMPFERKFHDPMFHDPVMRMFDESFLRPFRGEGPFWGEGTFRVDVKDRGDHYEIKADLPGVRKDAIDVTVDHDMLTISADFGEEEKQDNRGFTHTERRTGSIARSFGLEGIDQAAISADYVDGVLILNLPKEQPDTPAVRHIAIGAGVPELTSGSVE